MCVAIVAQKDKVLTPAQLWAGWTQNSHGAGIAYLNDDLKVVITNGYMKYNEFQKVYQERAERYAANGPMLIHMRIRSAGDSSAANTHPFPIKGGAMIHNGTLFYPDYVPGPGLKKSDTRIFAESLFNILQLEHIQKAEKDILTAVGTHNKLCFLYDGGEYYIMNEKSGYWRDGIWFSNDSCKPRGGMHPAANQD